jgi:hypothetical protein
VLEVRQDLPLPVRSPPQLANDFVHNSINVCTLTRRQGHGDMGVRKVEVTLCLEVEWIRKQH